MARFIIEGQHELRGTIEVLGAKNAAMKMIAACILMSGKTVLENVPDILDIQKFINILEKLNVNFKRTGHRLEIDTSLMRAKDPDKNLVGAIRASIVLVGPFLSRFGKIRLPHPGGCNIGARPIDFHIEAFKKLGVKVTENQSFFEFEYNPSNNKISPLKTIKFPKISVGATENIILFATTQEGKQITIQNAAVEPEVIDLIEFLNKAGAKIAVQNRTIIITGQKTLKNVEYKVIPDRIEAGTFAIMAAITDNALKIKNIQPEHLESLWGKFRQMGVEFVKGVDFLYIKKSAESQKLKPIDITTAEYPGFPTDLQPPMGVLLTQAYGTSHIQENIFEHRLEYWHELEKMGAKIKFLNSHAVEIIGPTPFRGKKIESLDLRAGATLLIAGLLASGTTEIKHAENIDRGYEKIETRLQKIGAKIKRTEWF